MIYEAAGSLSRDLLDLFVGRAGFVRNQPGEEVLRHADLVLTIGYDPIEYDPTVWLAGFCTRVIHLDAVPATVERAYRPAVELIGNVALNLDARRRRDRHLRCRRPRDLDGAYGSVHGSSRKTYH